MSGGGTRVKVNIFGEEYTLRGHDDPDWIRATADRVDRKLRELSSRFGNLGRTRLAILAALHLSEEIETLQQKLHERGAEQRGGRPDAGGRPDEHRDPLAGAAPPGAAGGPAASNALREADDPAAAVAGQAAQEAAAAGDRGAGQDSPAAEERAGADAPDVRETGEADDARNAPAPPEEKPSADGGGLEPWNLQTRIFPPNEE